ncbi:flagellar basal body protein, partial [Rhodoblastus sp.]
MQPLTLFSLASQNANWLATRQVTIASNVANANTPGYRAQDVAPFNAVLSHLQL